MKKRATPAPAPDTIERRIVTLERCEVRAATGDTPATFVGYAAMFNELSLDLGGFRERIAPACFQQAIENGADVRLLINHDSNLILGRTTAGTLTVREDDVGLWVEAALPDTSYSRDLQVSMDRGDITQMSFGFRATRDAWNHKDPESGLPIRELIEADLFDVSPVTFPAYPQTTAEVRALAERAAEAEDLTQTDQFDFPLAARDHGWDAAAAEARLRIKTGTAADGDNARYANCYAGSPDARLICDVVEGDIVVVPRALEELAATLDPPAEEARAAIEAWYVRMATEFNDDTIVAPWAAAADEEAREGKVLSDSNRALVQEAVDHAQAACEKLSALLGTDPAASGENSLDDKLAELRMTLQELRDSRPDFVGYLARMTEHRGWNWDDDWSVYILTNMISMASSFMVGEDDDDDVADIAAMRQIMLLLNQLLVAEIDETADDPAPSANSADPAGVTRELRLRLLERE